MEQESEKWSTEFSKKKWVEIASMESLKAKERDDFGNKKWMKTKLEYHKQEGKRNGTQKRAQKWEKDA